MQKKLIIFDLDGVLFDTPKITNDFFLHEFPTMTPKIMNEILCGNFHEELRKFKLTNPRITETAEEKTARNAAYSEKKNNAPMYDGVRELLERLHINRHVLTVNTSALAKNCLPLLERSGTAKFFDFVATKEVSESKVEKFKIICEKYSVTPQQTLFITDTLGDIREADAMHIPTIAVTWGAMSKAYLTREPHANLIAVVDSAGQLSSLLI